MFIVRRRIATITVAALILFGAFLSAFYAQYTAENASRAEAEQVLLDSAREQSNTLSAALTGRMQALEAFSSDLGSQGVTDQEELTRRVASFVSDLALGFSEGDYFNSDGLSLNSPSPDINARDRDYFQRSMQGQPAIERVIGLRTQQPMLVMSVPYSCGGQVIGVIIGIYYEEQLRSFLTGDVFGDESFSMILDSKGQVVINVEYEKYRLSSNSSSFIDDFAANSSITSGKEEFLSQLRECFSTGEDKALHYSRDGEPRIAIVTPFKSSTLPETDWFVLNIVKRSVLDNATAARTRAALTATEIFALFAVLALAAFLLLERAHRREEKKNADSLRKREEQFRIVVEQSGKSVFTYNISDGSALQYSRPKNGLNTGPSTPDVVETMIDGGTVDPDSVDGYRAFFADIERGVSPVTGVFLLCETSGRQRWYQHDATTVFSRDGKPDYAIVSYYDVTDQMEAAARYKNSLAYREIAQQNTIGSCHVNITRGVIDSGVSDYPELYHVTDGRISELIENVMPNLPDDATRLSYRRAFSRKSLLRAFARGLDHVQFEHQLSIGGGRYIWITSYVSMTRNPETNDIEGFFYAIDIDDKHRTSQLLSTVVDADYDYIVTVDTDTGKYRTFLRKGGATTCFHGNGVFGAELGESFKAILHPDDREQVLPKVRLPFVIEQLSEQERYEVYFRIIENGATRNKHVTCLYLDDSRRSLIYFRKDITDTVVSLEQARAAAEQAGHAKSDFLARMSHEIRTPLNAVLGFAQLGLDASTGEPAAYFSQIAESGQYLLELINDILDVSRIESGKLELHPGWYPITEIIQPVLDMLEPTIADKGIKFLYPDVQQLRRRSLECYVDKMRLQQIIVNLLNNSCKFTPTGGVITWRSEHLGHDSATTNELVTISDTGCGMSSSFLGHIGEPFAQESNSFSSSVSGTGLGLYIVKKICDAIGSELTVISEPGSGSSFSFKLSYPYRVVSSQQPSHLPGAFDLSQARILLAEDNELNRLVAEKLLESVGALVESAENGKIALDMFSASAAGYYNAILMDVRMPVMNGLESAQAIRALPRPDASAIPIIALSANAFDSDIKASLDAGMNAHLSKPIEPKILFATLSEACARQADSKLPR